MNPRTLNVNHVPVLTEAYQKRERIALRCTDTTAPTHAMTVGELACLLAGGDEPHTFAPAMLRLIAADLNVLWSAIDNDNDMTPSNDELQRVVAGIENRARVASELADRLTKANARRGLQRFFCSPCEKWFDVHERFVEAGKLACPFCSKEAMRLKS